MKFKFFKSIYATILLTVSCFSHVAHGGLINDINVESVSYGVTSGSFGWQASYDISFINQDLIIDVDVFLTGDDAGDSLKAIWKQGIEGLWSNAFDIFDGSYYYDTLFNVDWFNTSVGADHTVNVHNGNGNVNLGNWFTGNPSGWGYANQDRIAAHEFGHMIGLFDEYTGGALNPAGLIRSNSIMGQNLTSPQSDHFNAFTGWLSDKSGINSLSVVADSGLHNYQLSVPEPSSFAIFMLGMIGLAFRRIKVFLVEKSNDRLIAA